jgi:hypothetical protein
MLVADLVYLIMEFLLYFRTDEKDTSSPEQEAKPKATEEGSPADRL